MAASYQTGPASSPDDLLAALCTWLVAQGWTQNMAPTTDSNGKRAHLSKSSVYLNLRSVTAATEIIFVSQGTNKCYGVGLYLGTGYSGAAAWNAQAGKLSRKSTKSSTGV